MHHCAAHVVKMPIITLFAELVTQPILIPSRLHRHCFLWLKVVASLLSRRKRRKNLNQTDLQRQPKISYLQLCAEMRGRGDGNLSERVSLRTLQLWIQSSAVTRRMTQGSTSADRWNPPQKPPQTEIWKSQTAANLIYLNMICLWGEEGKPVICCALWLEKTSICHLLGAVLHSHFQYCLLLSFISLTQSLGAMSPSQHWDDKEKVFFEVYTMVSPFAGFLLCCLFTVCNEDY